MINSLIKLILIFLLVITPIAFGSVELWAFSLMELGILLIIILWSIRSIIVRPLASEKSFNSALRIPHSAFVIVLLSLFLLLILFQLLPLPSGLLKIISPKTYFLRQSLSFGDFQSAFRIPYFAISFVPFATQIDFFKWLTLYGLFLFLLGWKSLQNGYRVRNQLILAVFVVGVCESLYGMFEFFSGHGQILHLEDETLVHSVTGTFINRNYFAGYLLMVIPLSVGLLFSREAAQRGRFMGWRHQLSSLDGKTLLIGFGVIVMILGLVFSASRMGISSLLLSFTLISLLFRDPKRGQRFSRTSVLIFVLALFWAAWIGLDAVISRFFTASEDFKSRWEIWVNTFQIIKDFPLFGSGLGTFTQVFPMYRSFHIRGLVTHAENDFLQLTSEVGFIGIGLVIIVFVFLFFKACSGVRLLSHRESERYIRIGGLVGILALMFHSLVERNIQVPANAFLYTFIWTLVLRTGVANKGEGLTEKGASNPP